MPPEPTDLPAACLYHAFLVRLWRADPHAPWRASVTPVGGATVRFADPAAAWAYVCAQRDAEGQADVSGERKPAP